MDEHYNFQAAASTLESIIEERATKKPELQAVNLAHNIDQFVIVKTTLPMRWRLLSNVKEEERQELVLRVQGIISLKDLPPLQRERRKKIHDAKFIRQGVQLTGLDSPTFQSCINNISMVYAQLSRHFQEGDLHAWKPDTFMTHSAINVYNHYFYTTNDCPKQASIAFGDDIDPDHTLATLGLASGLIHTTDNQVEYFKIASDKKFTHASPTLFRVGDIVEAHFSVVIVPVKQNKYQMILVLRGLALLEGSLSQIAHTNRILKKSTPQNNISTFTLKRNTCYDDNEEREVQVVRKRLSDMIV